MRVEMLARSRKGLAGVIVKVGAKDFSRAVYDVPKLRYAQ